MRLRRKNGEFSHIEFAKQIYRLRAIASIYRIAVRQYPDAQSEGNCTMTENKNELREMTIEFALSISDLCDEIKGCRVYVDQIIRSSSSIGANLFEAKYAQSRADFVHKLELSLKECSETEYWLALLHRKRKLSDNQFLTLNQIRGTIQRKLIASITTAKNNGAAR
ncbi:MAG: hypothetical protein CW335_01340 [Clostridiales bacterium]|nr:hypothetical protein [Clostridiales bacterium]